MTNRDLPGLPRMAKVRQVALHPAGRRLSRTTPVRGLAFFLWEKRWFFIAMLVGGLIMQLPTPDGLSREGLIVLAMSVASVILFVTEPVPLPTVALMIIAGQVLLLGLDSSAVAKSLMSDSVLFIMGSLMLAVAIVKQNLDKRIAYLIVRMTGTKTSRICVGISLVSGILASIVGEHTVAAMMLPVAITLITLTSDDPKKVRRLAAVLLFSISYGCSIASIGTPSGGARNAIMIGYWKEFFFDPSDPETRKFIVDYVTWVLYCYPIFLIQLPFVTAILFMTFRPEYANMARAVVRLRQQIDKQGPMKSTDWVTIVVFALTLYGWIAYSDTLGLGIVAILGACAFLIIGMVRWEDINSGVNWGVVLLYAAAISLGVEMKETGAAIWVASSFLELIAPLGIDSGVPLWTAVSALTTGVTNTMSNGAAVAVLGPINLKLAVAAGESPILMGFVTAISSAFAYLTVIGTPACTIVYSSGYLSTTDFLVVGYRMVIMSTFVLILAAYLYWPLLGL
ncbi:MAG: DASS family sodium-coupled anion symporter [Hyphomicrobiaceae bacterium]